MDAQHVRTQDFCRGSLKQNHTHKSPYVHPLRRSCQKIPLTSSRITFRHRYYWPWNSRAYPDKHSQRLLSEVSNNILPFLSCSSDEINFTRRNESYGPLKPSTREINITKFSERTTNLVSMIFIRVVCDLLLMSLVHTGPMLSRASPDGRKSRSIWCSTWWHGFRIFGPLEILKVDLFDE